MKARAAVWTAKHRIEVRELPIPEVKPDGLLLKVEAAGVCGTDGHLIEQDPPYPAIMGHEIVGRIVALGAEANRTLNVRGGPVAVGDRLALYPWIMNPRSEGCLRFGPGTCTVTNDSFVYGIPYSMLGLGGREIISSRIDEAPHFKGGFAEYVHVFPDTYAWKVPDDMPADVAALLDPLAVAVRTVELAQTLPGVPEEAFNTSARIVVVGAGPIGLLTALVARVMGVERIVVVGARERRLRLCREIAEVEETIDIHATTPAERLARVRDLTGGGADVVFDCANTPAAFVESLELVRRLGTVVEAGNMVNVGTTVALDPARLICGKHARVIGMSANHPGAFDKAFRLLGRHRRIPFHRMLTHEARGVGELLPTLGRMRDADYLKAVLHP